ncbi:hypothetical protein BJV77DRAFT_1068090 [Russula vinacea]|nr:hypothetical protein BJV77DRAFT_1068090 [Russula vinacea]
MHLSIAILAPAIAAPQLHNLATPRRSTNPQEQSSLSILRRPPPEDNAHVIDVSGIRMANLSGSQFSNLMGSCACRSAARDCCCILGVSELVDMVTDGKLVLITPVSYGIEKNNTTLGIPGPRYLKQFETFVLDHNVRPVDCIAQHLIVLHSANGRPDRAERVVWDIDIACLDIDQVPV